MTAFFLNASKLNYSYRALPVLHDISWQWLPGEQWACLGPNGSGKTTLAKLLSKQLRITSGELHTSADLNTIAYVCFEQQQALCARDDRFDDSEMRADAHDPGTTVEQAILNGEHASGEFSKWAQRLRIEHILQRGIRFISTGEMRKTLLLRAILSGPDLLILDSPLDGLDIQSQAEMSTLIEDLLASPLRVMLLCRQAEDLPKGVSHILALNEGSIIASGERETVLASAAVEAVLNPPQADLGNLPAPAQRAYSVAPDAPLLDLHSVNVSYDGVRVLHNVEWTFAHGQHCCVSGPNGCGKTTLLSLVTGDNHKAYGQDITLFGVLRGSGESVWDIKQKFGLVDTKLHLNFARGMKALEVVVSGFFDTVGLYDDWGDQQRQTASDWLQALGLGTYERESFDSLSFGVQRMVLLARAMVKSPQILILDEPCLGLDGPHRRTVLRAIDHIANNSDTQVIYVSHSSGEMPACINQQVTFVPGSDGFDVVCR
ncbi:ATP-binding cassette domain-containing protein [Halieaceae bacterium IMCC14734]|uniref:ATP-binding cassette domain-containing protein n=1 Tax=Candidatus Litorirhabdus singularis TaxID=2518993 RepID=A0ABT3TNI6_9GAMM|nr:ATP-binding cassette domain-containing protein [Candidatus Litorirhabdus singularis]MCX2983330.1 ATP-binding cassette domain-containing protein [Candidatus Litorirhabdus singularis]